VCSILDIKVASPERFSLNEKGITQDVTHSAGNQQKLTYISKPHLYRVIFRSNKKEPQQLQSWGFKEVLSAIRKIGKYEQSQAAEEYPERPSTWKPVTKIPVSHYEEAKNCLRTFNRRPRPLNPLCLRLKRFSSDAISARCQWRFKN
jgi:prophage antirepressor-like protein